MIKADGYDAAIIGQASVWRDQGRHDVIVYDAHKIIGILVERDGMTEEEATEFFEFNVEGAYVGVSTPVYVWSLDPDYEVE